MPINSGLAVTFYTELPRTPETEQLMVNRFLTQTGEESACTIPEEGTINGMWMIVGEAGVLAFKEPQT